MYLEMNFSSFEFEDNPFSCFRRLCKDGLAAKVVAVPAVELEEMIDTVHLHSDVSQNNVPFEM